MVYLRIEYSGQQSQDHCKRIGVQSERGLDKKEFAESSIQLFHNFATCQQTEIL